VGAVDLGEIGGAVQIETGAGSIRLGSAKGRVEAQTGGGSIQLNGATSVKAETGAGGITVKLVSSSDLRSNSTLETSAGDITVYFANDLPSQSGQKSKWAADIRFAATSTISIFRASAEAGPARRP